MIKNYYWAMAVIAAFVAGTIATATPVFAPPPEDDGEGGWKAAVAEQQAQIDELKANEILGFYLKIGTPGDDPEEAIVFCDTGDVATGGGGTGIMDSSLRSSSFVKSGFIVNGWQALANLPDEILAVAVICADYDPVHTP